MAALIPSPRPEPAAGILGGAVSPSPEHRIPAFEKPLLAQVAAEPVIERTAAPSKSRPAMKGATPASKGLEAYDPIYRFRPNRLRTAGHLVSGPAPKDGSGSGKAKDLAVAFFLQISGLLAAIYLYKFSDLPFLIGVTRNRA